MATGGTIASGFSRIPLTTNPRPDQGEADDGFIFGPRGWGFPVLFSSLEREWPYVLLVPDVGGIGNVLMFTRRLHALLCCMRPSIRLAREAAEYLRQGSLIYAVPRHAFPNSYNVLAGLRPLMGLARFGFFATMFSFDESVFACERAHRGAPGYR